MSVCASPWPQQVKFDWNTLIHLLGLRKVTLYLLLYKNPLPNCMSVTQWILKLYMKALARLNTAHPHSQRCTYIQLYPIECANVLTRTQCIRVKPETLCFFHNCKHEPRPKVHLQIVLLYIRWLCSLRGKLYFMRISLFHLALICGAFM